MSWARLESSGATDLNESGQLPPWPAAELEAHYRRVESGLLRRRSETARL